MKKEQANPISIKDHLNFIAMVFCFWMAIYIYAPVFGVYLETINFSYSTIGVILGSYGVTQVLFRLPLGVLSDHLQGIRKNLLIIGFVMALLSNLLLVYFESFLVVIIARLLIGITASMWVMATVLYSYYFTAQHSAKAMGIMQFVTVATQFLGMAISGYLVYLFGWTFPFWLGTIASAGGIYFSWKIKDVPSENEKAKPEISMKQHIIEVIRIPNLLIITFLSLVAHAILFITIFGFSPIIASSVGVSEKLFVWLIIAFFIPHILASISFIFFELPDRFIKVIIVSSFIVTAVCLLSIQGTVTLLKLNVAHVGIGLALGVIFPLLLSEVVKISPDYLKMSAMGFYQSFYAIGILLGPILAGIVANSFGLLEVFLSTGVLSLIVGIMSIFLIRSRP
ncbi:MFS transporter [Sporosarcina sp. Marseille-Q4063]|uniref:MFS transporter n=1 Tax=Sporosarcina sp. Marseille-Q4063 TaxID=2810514 RepID=UPI001BAE639A|nr:MFS transporter [Sporosarcina sp. Marseille-Q4063]QUW21449.1 MFS transporter [Sporosarcina sp. Marseille-Q4063]